MYERKNTTMKKLLLLLIPLLIGCGKTTSESSVSSGYSVDTTKENKENDEQKDEMSTSSFSYYQSKAIVNVLYSWDYDTHCYIVYTIENTYYVPPKNYYEIKVDEYKREITIVNGEKHYGDYISNEYFVESNELFVYYK